jgi:ankyrin repeat protein
MSSMLYDEDIDETDIGDDPHMLLSSETAEKIRQAKKENQSKFISHWEADEQDIDTWTEKEMREDPGKLLLHLAEYGKLDEIKELIESQTDTLAKQKLLMYKDSDGYTALHRAAYSSQLDVVKYLISFENRPDMPDLKQLEAKTDMGWTPLHSAAYWNAFKVVDYFLNEVNANVNIQTNSGQTSLHLAAQQSTGRETLILLLTHPDIDFSIENNQKETAHDIANRMCKYNSLFEIADENLNKL